MTTLRKSSFQIGLGIAIFTAAASITSAMLHFQPSLQSKFQGLGIALKPSAKVCNTIATDPSPPLNVRSSPVVAPDNVVGTVRNGTRLSVVDQNEGWLRINQPLEGWVYQNLTVTSCISAKEAAIAASDTVSTADNGLTILAAATERYQAGDLNGAIALAQSIPASSAAVQPAKGAVNQWQHDWKTAETELAVAQKALNEGRPQDVLSRVRTFPENRFWRAQLTPIVKAAIQQQSRK